MKYFVAAVLLLMLVATSSADARPTLTQDKIDAFAVSEMKELNEAFGTTFHELDPCEIEGRRAYCDYTLDEGDWGICDGIMTVQYTRRGKLASSFEDLDCVGGVYDGS